MATQDDIRRIALALPGVSEGETGFAFTVQQKGKTKGFAWVWMERIHPKQPKVANPDVVALRVGGASEKQLLLSADTEKFFTEPHYNGFPAILVRLSAFGLEDVEELEELVADAWRCLAPKALVQEFDARS